ncbi:unnamed protein product [Cochlearia groenlandica]
MALLDIIFNMSTSTKSYEERCLNLLEMFVIYKASEKWLLFSVKKEAKNRRSFCCENGLVRVNTYKEANIDFTDSYKVNDSAMKLTLSRKKHMSEESDFEQGLVVARNLTCL